MKLVDTVNYLHNWIDLKNNGELNIEFWINIIINGNPLNVSQHGNSCEDIGLQ